MKKAIKIALIILLVATMLFVLTGCGKEEKENKTTENKVVTEEKEEQKEETKAEFSMGEWKGSTYENEFIGIKFNLPENWVYSSEAEIAKMMNLGTDLLNDDQKKLAELSKLNSVYYLVANNPNTGDNLSVLSEKTIGNITAEYYLNQLKTQLAAVESIKYEIGSVSKEEVAGREYETLSVTATMSGIEMAQKYYVYKMDEYFVCIVATSTNGETGINDMMKSFK